jgi:hypothetical protein
MLVSKCDIHDLLTEHFGNVRYDSEHGLYFCNWSACDCEVLVEDATDHPFEQKNYWNARLSIITKFSSNCLVVTKNDEVWVFGILTYYEFERINVNRHIKLRKFTEDSIQWLKLQLTARHNHIRFLPPDMLRIEKIISLNSTSLLNGEVRYFRTFREGYKMKQPNYSSEQEQLNRYIHGTPESEYPKDIVDDIIFKAVVSVYPEAIAKSKQFLFDSDLLNIRLLKDYKTETQKIYAFNKYRQALIPIAELEILHLYNAWKDTKVRDIIVSIECENDEEVERLSRVFNEIYEPFSKMNI